MLLRTLADAILVENEVHVRLHLIVPGPYLVKIGLLMLTRPGQQVHHVQIQMGMLRAKASLSEREDMRACLGDVAVRAFDVQHSAGTVLRPALSRTVDGKAAVGCCDRLDLHPQGIVLPQCIVSGGPAPNRPEILRDPVVVQLAA